MTSEPTHHPRRDEDMDQTPDNDMDPNDQNFPMATMSNLELKDGSTQIAGMDKMALAENSSLGERIYLARRIAGFTQRELAQQLNISQATVHRWECGVSASCNKTAAIAGICQVDAIWLDTGEGVPQYGSETKINGKSSQSSHNLAIQSFHLAKSLADQRLNQHNSQLPLLYWHAVPKLASGIQELIPDEWVAGYVPPVFRVSPHAFALEVTSDSMEPDFFQGDIVIVDPLIQYQHKSYVIAYRQGGDAFLRQVTMDGGISYLNPCNERYPNVQVDKNILIIGTVKAKYKDY